MENFMKSYGEPGYVSRAYDGVGRVNVEGKKPGRWKRILLPLLLLLLVYLLRGPLLTAAGSALVAADAPQHGDIIVVLMGSCPDRIVMGVELYREGLAERILMAGNHDFNTYELVEALSLEIPGMAEINREIALQLGVPWEAITILGVRADSTREEALAVRDYLQAQQLGSILLVTSPYHSLRAKKTFERVLGNDCLVISLPSPYDSFDTQGWWRERRQLRNVFFEYQKLISFYIFRQ